MSGKAKECGSKIRYEQRRLAEDEVRRLYREWRAQRLHAYRCGHCGGWHVGHKMAYGRRWS